MKFLLSSLVLMAMTSTAFAEFKIADCRLPICGSGTFLLLIL